MMFFFQIIFVFEFMLFFDWLVGLFDVFGKVGMKVFVVVFIIVSCVVIGFILCLVICCVVYCIVDSVKNKVLVDDIQVFEWLLFVDMWLVQCIWMFGMILQNIVNVMFVVIVIVLIVNVFDQSFFGLLILLMVVVGVGLGFGVQNIVKDVFNGMFFVVEDQIGIGDVVDFGFVSGVVEYVSVCIIQVCDVNGMFWYVCNGEVICIGNMLQGWVCVIIDFGVLVDLDFEQVEYIMFEIVQGFVKDLKWCICIIEKLELWGLELIDGDVFVVWIVIKVCVNVKDDVVQEFW